MNVGKNANGSKITFFLEVFQRREAMLKEKGQNFDNLYDFPTNVYIWYVVMVLGICTLYGTI